MSPQTPSSPPPSSLRPVPPTSGAGKNVAIIVVLVGAMVALFAWRSCQTASVTVAPVPSTPVPVVTSMPPVQEPLDIPPPPAIPDAAPDTGKKAPVVVSGGGGGDGCGQTTCGGTVSTELSNALAFRARTAHKCYDEALAQDSTLKGQVVINVRVGTSGAVCAASVGSSDIANPSVASCIANRFRQGARLPAPTGGCAEVNVPMRLLPPH